MAEGGFDPLDYRNSLLAIQTGIWDEYLESIQNALSLRRRQVAIDKAAGVLPGDVISISDRVRPKLLAGKRFRVNKLEGDKVHGVLLDDTSSSKWRRGGSCWIAFSLIGEVLERD